MFDASCGTGKSVGIWQEFSESFTFPFEHSKPLTKLLYMIRMIKQAIGHDAIAIGVSGTSQEIEQTMLSLWNWGAIDSQLHIGSPETFQYGISTEAKLLAYFHSIGELQFDVDRVQTPAMESYLASHARKSFDAISDETFLHYGQEHVQSEYAIGCSDGLANWENSVESFLCRD